MTHPISHYWIFTGHNSYLTGNQLSSDSSDAPIIAALQRGVRVVELDLWPDDKGGIKVTHGKCVFYLSDPWGFSGLLNLFILFSEGSGLLPQSLFNSLNCQCNIGPVLYMRIVGTVHHDLCNASMKRFAMLL